MASPLDPVETTTAAERKNLYKPPLWRLPPALWLALGCMAVIRFTLMLGTGPIHDEAYYWTWSQRLDYGYYDQPFLVGWLLWPFVSLLGDQAWVLRLASGGLTLLTSAFLARLALDLSAASHTVSTADDGQLKQATNGLLFLFITSPGLWGLGLFYVHDTVMMTCLSLGLLLGTRAVQQGSMALWLVTGLALGLAFSAKVSAALWIAAFGLALLISPSGRAQLTRPGPWISALFVLAAVALFVVWNANHGWVTFRHVSTEHLTAEPDRLGDRLGRFGLVAIGVAVLAGPGALVLFRIPGWPAPVKPGKRPDYQRIERLGITLFIALPLLFIFGLSLARDVLLNWLLPSTLVLTAVAASRWPGAGPEWLKWAGRTLSVTTGAVLCLLLLIPLAMREPRWMLENARDLYGWRSAIADLQAYRDAVYPGHSIVGHYYLLASQLAFHQNHVRPSVGTDPRPHQLRLFADPNDATRTAQATPLLVLAADAASGRAALQDAYCSLRPLGPWPVTHGAVTIDTPYLFRVDRPRRADGLCPSAQSK